MWVRVWVWVWVWGQDSLEMKEWTVRKQGVLVLATSPNASRTFEQEQVQVQVQELNLTQEQEQEKGFEKQVVFSDTHMAFISILS